MKELVLVFKKIKSDDEINYDTFYSCSKAEIVINKSDIDDIFESIYSMILRDLQNLYGKGLGWIIDCRS